MNISLFGGTLRTCLGLIESHNMKNTTVAPVDVTVGKLQNSVSFHQAVHPFPGIGWAILKRDVSVAFKRVPRRFVNNVDAKNDVPTNRKRQNEWKIDFGQTLIHFKTALKHMVLNSNSLDGAATICQMSILQMTSALSQRVHCRCKGIFGMGLGCRLL
jgi:hypothetical protein